MELDGGFLYRQIWAGNRPAPHNVIVQQRLPGPARSIWFSGWTKRWEFDPATIQRVTADDVDQGNGTVTFVDRPQAEQVEHSLGTTLPSEPELTRMMEAAAAQMATSQDPGTPIPVD